MNNGHIRIENDIFDFLIDNPLNDYQNKLFKLALKKVNGFREETFKLSYGYVAKKLNISRRYAIKQLQSMVEANIFILVESGFTTKTTNVYKLNKLVNSYSLVNNRSLVEAKKARARRNLKKTSERLDTSEQIYPSEQMITTASEQMEHKLVNTQEPQNNIINNTLLELNTRETPPQKIKRNKPKKSTANQIANGIGNNEGFLTINDFNKVIEDLEFQNNLLNKIKKNPRYQKARLEEIQDVIEEAKDWYINIHERKQLKRDMEAFITNWYKRDAKQYAKREYKSFEQLQKEELTRWANEMDEKIALNNQLS